MPNLESFIIMKKNRLCPPILMIMILLCSAGISSGEEPLPLSMGQQVYVPAYSHIYSGNREIRSNLTVTLSVRNTDPAHGIEIVSVDYYDTKGILIKKYLSAPVLLPPLGTVNYIVANDDKTGGSGANFLVKWHAGQKVNQPIIETVMIGSRSSFTTRGRPITPSN